MPVDIRKRLKSLQFIDSKVRSKHQEIISLKSGILRGQQYSNDPKGGTKRNKSEELNVLIIDKADKIYKEIEELYAERDELVRAIESLEDPIENIVMRLFYINGYSVRDIERELPLSRRTIFYAKNKGLDKIIAQFAPFALSE